MTRDELISLGRELTDALGLTVVAQSRPSGAGNVVVVIPADVHPNEAFSIEISASWRSAVARFVPGNFARHFVEEMGRANVSGKETFAAISRHLVSRRLNVTVTLNGQDVDATEQSTWPTEWQTLRLEVSSPPFDPTAGSSARADAIRSTAHAVLALVLSLGADDPDVEAAEAAESGLQGFPEGGTQRIVVNRYERDQRNRGLCLAAYGFSCRVCGIDFGSSYGPVAAGFIHVHHIVPVSRLTPGYVVNPVTDLVPLCPNCHAVVHRSDPPLSVEEVSSLWRQSQS